MQPLEAGNGDSDAARVSLVGLSTIQPSPRNPRTRLTGIDELAASIQSYGLLQPIILRRLNQGYEVVAGHRRLAAVQSLGWTLVPSVVREVEPDDAYLLTLVENLQRDDLSPREQSRALEVLVRERKWTTRQVAAAIKRSASYVSRRLRVFEDPLLGELVLSDQLSVSAAEELLPLPQKRKELLAREAAEHRWEPHQVRTAITHGPNQGGSRRRRVLSTRVRELRQILREASTDQLSEAERRELRLLFHDLVLLARAPSQRKEVVIPPLQTARAAR